MSFEFRPATRAEAKPLIGFYSESDGGKTFSSLLLARGFVGPQGRIGMIETESGRGEAYANPKEYPELTGPHSDRNYDVLPLRGEFSPTTYGKAITAAEDTKLDALIIDSASHEWEGIGGVLSMAAANQEAGKKGPIVWQKPKIDHQRNFMLRFMQTSIPLVILNMRAKYPMTEVQLNGKKEWKRSEKLEPKQADDILFEMFIHGWFSTGDHNFHPTRLSGRGLEKIFIDGQKITLETGKQLAVWAKGYDPAKDRLISIPSGALPSNDDTFVSLDDYLHDIQNAISLDALQFKFKQAYKQYSPDAESLEKLTEAKDKRKTELAA